MKHFKLNQKVKVHPENDNDCYDDFRNEILIIINISKNASEHKGYDNGMYPEYLYDLKTLAGKNIPVSLYDYELVAANKYHYIKNKIH
jgi:hypothetical protein